MKSEDAEESIFFGVKIHTLIQFLVNCERILKRVMMMICGCYF